MALSFIAASSWAASASTSTAPAPAMPAGWAAGDLLILTIHYKQRTAFMATFPTGWDVLGSGSSFVSTSYGGGVGDTTYILFSRVAQVGDAAPTISTLTGGSTNSTSGNVMIASISAYRGSTGSYSIKTVSETQASSATSWSSSNTTVDTPDGTGSGVTNAAIVAGDFAAGDMLHMTAGMASSVATQSAQAFAITGITVGAITVSPTKGTATIGADIGATTHRAAITAGSNTGTTATHSLTQSTATYGTLPVVRIREAGAAATAAPRNIFTSNPAIVRSYSW